MEANIYHFYRCILAVLFTLSGALALAQEQLNVKVFNQTNTSSLPTNVFQRVEVDGKGHVWVGTNGLGLVKFSPEDSSWTRAITNHQVRAITKDSNGDIWVGSGSGGVQATGGGIRKFIKGDLSSFTYWGATTGALNRYVNGLAEGHNNTIWAAHGQTITSAYPNDKIDEGGVGWYDGTVWNKITRNLNIENGMPKGDVRVLSVAKVGDKMWVGVDRSCINGTCAAPYIAEYSAAGAFIRKVSDGLPFVNTVGGPLPRSIYHDSKGRTWIGLSSGDGVVAVYENNSWTVIDNSIMKLPTGTAVNFQSIREDKSGYIWIGTSNGLLSFYGQETTEAINWNLFTIENGLPANFINGIAIDSTNNKWLTTSAGVAKVSSSGLSLKVIHQLKNKERKAVSKATILDSVEIFQKEIGTIKTKVSVDGSESTSFILNASNINEYSIEIVYLHDVEQEGRIVDTTYRENELEVLYKHPTYFRNSLTWPDYNVYFSIKRNGEVVHYFDIKAVRPPIVMVHGIFGNYNTFDGMEQDLTSNYALYNPKQAYKVSYLNDISFEVNKIYIIEAINRVIESSKSVSISAGKVDVVCHSMGGLVTRAYIQSRFFRNDINKLITINTPHSGSQITNLILHPSMKGVLGWITYNVMGGSILSAGAAKSMLVDGEAIAQLNNPQNLSKSTVPTHVITSRMDQSYFAEMAAKKTQPVGSFIPILKLIGPAVGLTVDELLDRLYVGEEHDTTVPIGSQEAGLLSPFKTEFDNIMHPGSNNNPSIVAKVVELSSVDPRGIQFSQGAINPKTMPVPTLPLLGSIASTTEKEPESSIILVENTNRLGSTSNETLSVISPTKDFVATPGSSVNISVKGSDNINRIYLIIGNKVVDVYSDLKNGQENTFAYTVPENAVGKMYIGAFGIGTNGIEAVDTSAFFMVEPSAVLTSISGSPEKLILVKGLSERIKVDGTYNDGAIREVTFLNNVMITSKTGKVLVKEGRVTGLSVGVDTVDVEYNGQKIQIPIVVTENVYNTKESQTINFSQLPDRMVGDKPFALEATTSSGLSVKFVIVSGPASVQGNIVTLTGEGIVVVRAMQEGNIDYSAAADVTVSFCVVPAKPTLTQEESKLNSSSPTGNQWYFNGTAIEGATSQAYTATETGIYTVQVSGSCGLSEMSEAITYNVTTVEDELAQAIHVYPNPASEALFVDIPKNIVLEGVALYSAQGKVLSVVNGDSKNMVKVNVSTYAKGLHIIQIKTDKGIIYKKVVLK